MRLFPRRQHNPRLCRAASGHLLESYPQHLSRIYNTLHVPSTTTTRSRKLLGSNTHVLASALPPNLGYHHLLRALLDNRALFHALQRYVLGPVLNTNWVVHVYEHPSPRRHAQG